MASRDRIEPGSGGLRGDEEFLRVCPGSGGESDVVLAGVVHDHPASAVRVRAVVRTVEPAVVAVELPPLAVPLYERLAADERTPPSAGGEMSTAIQAASTAEVRGIDGPSIGFLRRLGRALSGGDAGPKTTRAVVTSVASATRHAFACRLAALAPDWLYDPSAVDAAVQHGCDRDDDPAELAAHERAQYRRARAIAGVVGPSSAIRLLETTREAHMAEQLALLRRRGPVVGVVGAGHLDPVSERLRRSA